jgi:hypothetical protein
MSLVRWFRKNNTKLMAVVVIILMVAFIGGSSLTYLLQSKGDRKAVFATIANGTKITQSDFIQAGNELEILKNLGADNILKMLSYSLLQVPDMHAVILSEVLFSEQKGQSAIIGALSKQVVENMYRVNEKQISDLYNRTTTNNIYWLCLCNEAQEAGIKISNEQAGKVLGETIPRIFNNATYAQYMSSMVKNQGLSESQILVIFAKLLAVLQYSHLVCTNQDITLSQLKHITASQEGLDIEFVRFDSSIFAKSQAEPDEQAINAHFNKYKSYFLGQVSADNPYGFGYKLPERVRFEYMAIRLKDVAKIIKAPSQDEMEEYYNKYKSSTFSEQVRSDPNDPNSTMKTRVKPYSSVAQIISRELLARSINTRAQSIIQEAMAITNAKWKDYNDTVLSGFSAEKLATMAYDYKAAADQIGKKYNIKIYTDKTGLISALDIQKDNYLSQLNIAGSDQTSSIALMDIAFAVEQLGSSNIEIYNIQKPRLYQDIGPLVDDSAKHQESDEQIMAVMRVIETSKATEAQDVSYKYSTTAIVFEPNQALTEKQVYSVKNKIVEDLKKLQAMESTKTKAEEFIEQANASDWQSTIKKYNALYKTADVNEPFKLETKSNMRKISLEAMDILTEQYMGNPRAMYLNNDIQASKILIEKLFSLMPADANSTKIDSPIEFKPQQSYYCIKNMNINRRWKEDFESMKAAELYRQEISRSQSLAFVHLNPANILKRMNYKTIEK